MAIDNEQKRRAAATVGPPINAPSILPDGILGKADRYQIGWSYLGVAGELWFFGTVLGNGVATRYSGVTFDENGNLRVSGTVYEGP